MKKEELLKRLEMFKENANLIMTAKEVQMHIDLINNLTSQLSETEEKLKRAYTDILIGHIVDFTCHYCGEEVDMEFQGHSEDCIVLEAQTWLETKE